MPARIHIGIEVDDADLIRTQDLHYHVCRWIDATDGDHRSSEKPFAVSPLVRSEDGGFGFEVGVFHDGLLERLHTRVKSDRGKTLAFGRARGQLMGELGMDLISYASFDDLVALGRPATSWTLHVLSPTLWRKGNVDLPFPNAGSIVTGLVRRWSRWAPRPVSGRSVPRVAISGFDIASSHLKRADRKRTGFVGTVELAATGKPADLRTLDSLLQFAEYCGVGSMTTYGFGVVALEAHFSQGARNVRAATAHAAV